MRRLLMPVSTVLFALALSSSVTAGPQALPSGNLVQNPGAEAGPGATTTNQTVTPPGWTTTGALTAVAYDDRLGFPGPAIATAIGGGKNFFAGGNNAQTSTATQTIDVSASATTIDAGGVTTKLAAHLGGYNTHNDTTTIDLQLLDAGGAALASLRVGPVTNADRANQTKLLLREATGPVPVGTRQLRVTMTTNRAIGPYNDGYADNVSVTLLPKGAATAKPTLTARCARHTMTLAVRPAAGQKITSVTFLVPGRTPIVDRKAPFTIAFTPKKKTGTAAITARVLVSGKTVVLKKTAKNC